MGDDIITDSTTGKAGKTDAVRFFGEERDSRYMSNWNSVTHGNLGFCALILGDQPEWLARAEEKIAKYLELASDSTGAPFEGHCYLGYKQNAGLKSYRRQFIYGRQPRPILVVLDTGLRSSEDSTPAAGRRGLRMSLGV